jgi:hypothetical protein
MNDLIKPVKPEIIVTEELFDTICDDCKRFCVANTARDYFVYRRGFFSVSFPVVAVSNVKHKGW